MVLVQGPVKRREWRQRAPAGLGWSWTRLVSGAGGLIACIVTPSVALPGLPPPAPPPKSLGTHDNAGGCLCLQRERCRRGQRPSLALANYLLQRTSRPHPTTLPLLPPMPGAQSPP